MFNKGIHNTTLTSEVADRLFSNITASNAPDKSFLATLRALLRNRLPQNETVHLECKELHVSEADIRDIPVSQQIGWLMPDSLRFTSASEHNIHIVHTANPEAGKQIMENLLAHAGAGTNHMNNYTRRNDLHVFFARKTKALFFTDDTEKNTIIFTTQLEMKHFHALQMAIPRYLPRLFADTPLAENELALLKSIGNKSASEYEMLIEGFVQSLDIRTETIRIKLAKFETVFERNRADEVRNEISSYQSEYDRYLSMMNDLSKKIQERMYTLAGLECAINGQPEDSELMEYFICNRNLTIIQAEGTSIEFIVHGYADVYDEDAFERISANHDGYMYNSLHSDVSKVQMEKLYKAIFGEGKYKLRICAAYKADIQNGLTALSNYQFPTESSTYLPNPHIQYHGCVGGFSGRFQEYMHRRDYVGAINQTIVSARNLNFCDATVMSKFAKSLSSTTKKCIEKPDKTLLTPREAIVELEGGM